MIILLFKIDVNECAVGAEKSEPNPKSIFDTAHVIHVMGIPWTVTKQKMVEFFDDINILNGVNGIHFIIDHSKKNGAFIQVATKNDYLLAMKRQLGYTSFGGEMFSMVAGKQINSNFSFID